MDRTSNTKKLNWGILGTGGIAHSFARALGTSQTGNLLAVASRSEVNAQRFGDEFIVPRRYASYEALLADPAVEAVYISLPNHCTPYGQSGAPKQGNTSCVKNHWPRTWAKQ